MIRSRLLEIEVTTTFLEQKIPVFDPHHSLLELQ